MWWKQIDLNALLNNVEIVCNALGFKLGQSWEMCVNELPKMPWTSIQGVPKVRSSNFMRCDF